MKRILRKQIKTTSPLREDEDSEYHKTYTIQPIYFNDINKTPIHLLIKNIGKYHYTIDIELWGSNRQITLEKGNAAYKSYPCGKTVKEVYNAIYRILEYLNKSGLVTAQECSHILEDLQEELLKYFK
jgi:hypothetical protein